MHPSTSAFDLSHSRSWLRLLNSSKVWHCPVLCFFWNEWIARVEGDWSHSLGQQMASEMHKEAHNVSDCHSDHLFWMGQDIHPTIPWFSPLQPGVWNRQSTLAASVFHVLKSHSVQSISSHRLLVLIIMKQPSASLMHLQCTVPCFIEARSCERRWC